MKKTLVFLLPLWLAGTGLQAQLSLNGLNLNNSSCGYFDQQLVTLGPLTNTLIVGSSPTSAYQFVSANQIHIAAGSGSTFHAGAGSGSTGNFHAMVANQQLSVAFIEPSNINAVPRYSKVELGLNLTATLGALYENRIANFLNSTDGSVKPGTAGYNSAYANKTILNPYDPDQISVDAVFFKPSSPSSNGEIHYGFFYRNFNRVGNPTTNWTPSTTFKDDAYEWRIRIAPDELGVWNGYINVWIDGTQMHQTFAFSFTVVPSSNPGNVVIDNAHPRYLKFSGNNNTYFPIGDNYCWSSEDYFCTGGYNCSGSNGYAMDHRIKPTINEEMDTYLNALTGGTAGNGGNSTRIIMAPWGLQVEREKLNNYDTRQVEMWELDKIFEMMESKGVYCILTLNLAAEFLKDDQQYDNLYADYTEHWNWHPYADPNATGHDPYNPDTDEFEPLKGIPGVNDPIDFFTNQQSKQFFKKRLRYIVSRWGYSTSLSMYELLSEIDQMTVLQSYFNNNSPSTTAVHISNWHDEMYDYLRNGLKDPHIRTGTFTGDTYHGLLSDYNGTLLWSKPNIDMISGHQYMQREIGLRLEAQETRDILQIPQYADMPLFQNECDVVNYGMITAGTDWAIHNKHWATAMSGTCGAGLSWDWLRYYRWEHQPGNSPWNYDFAMSNYNGEYEMNYPALRSFTNLIDFRNYDYTPDECHSDFNAANPPSYKGADNKFETFYLKRNDQHAVYGWMHNRSYNIYTFDEPNPGNILNSYTLGNNTFNSFSDFTNYLTSNPPAWCQDNNPNTNCDAVNYWGYTSPQANYFNDDSYNNLFGTSYDAHPEAAGKFYVKGLLPNTTYQINWYWTWGVWGGQPAGFSSNITTNGNGVLIVNNAPPTGMVNSILYPGDWAFIVNLAGNGQRQAETGMISMPIPQLSALPNPSNGIFTLQSGIYDAPATIEVFTIDGRIVRSEHSNTVNGYKLDLSNEAEGVYFVKVTRDGQSKTVRIVKTAE